MLPPEHSERDEERRHGKQLARLPDLSECRQIEEDWTSREEKQPPRLAPLEERIRSEGREDHDGHTRKEREFSGVQAQLDRLSPQPDGVARHGVDVEDTGAQLRRD